MFIKDKDNVYMRFDKLGDCPKCWQNFIEKLVEPKCKNTYVDRTEIINKELTPYYGVYNPNSENRITFTNPGYVLFKISFS